MSDRDMDEQIRQTEQLLGGVTIAEALYGGPRGPGLTTNIARLTDNVTSLSATVAELSKAVTKVADDVNGGEGIRSSLKELKRQVDEITRKFERGERLFWRGMWALAGIGLGTILVDSRVYYTVFLEHTK